MRILITGSRNYNNFNEIYWILETIINKFNINPNQSTIIHGGCRGTDITTGHASVALGFKLELYPANWDKYGKATGPIRNREMVNANIDLVLAFPIGKSYGTRNTINKAEKKQIPIINVTESSRNKIINQIEIYKNIKKKRAIALFLFFCA